MVEDDTPLNKANTGRLTSSEKEFVCSEILAGRNLYSNMLILGRAIDPSYDYLFWENVENKDDPMLARLSLTVLFRYRRLHSECRDYVIRFINGVEWDRYDDVRTVALPCGVTLFHENSDIEALISIRSVLFCANTLPSLKAVAYYSLAKCLGMTKETLTIPEYIYDTKTEIDRIVIDNVDKIISSGEL